MKTSKKILIAVGAVVLVAALIVGTLFARSARKVPALAEETLLVNPLNEADVYVVGQPPCSDKWVFETQSGMNNYWREHHRGGNGIEVVLQQSKDGELVVLSEALPAKSNADDLYGADVQAGDLTLEELRRINLLYDFTDESGFQKYVDLTDAKLARVSVITLDELLEFYGAPSRTTVKLFLRFYDESKISDPASALQTIRDGLIAHSLENNAAFCPHSSAVAAAADESCPDMMRAATPAEAKSLLQASSIGKTPGDEPYSVIYVNASEKFASEKFIHYVRNLGMAIVLTGADADDAARLRRYGVTALATSDVSQFTQVLTDAMTEDPEPWLADD